MCLGMVGQVLAVGAPGCVEVDASDRIITASLLAMTDAVGPGDWVLMHSGLVLGRLTEEEAKDALTLRNPTKLRNPTNEGVPGTRHDEPACCWHSEAPALVALPFS